LASAEPALDVGVLDVEGAGEGQPLNVASATAVPMGLVYQAEWLDSSMDRSPGLGFLSGFSRLMAVRAPDGPVRLGERVLLTTEEGVSLQVGDVLQSFRPYREERGFGIVQRPSGILVVTQVGEAFIVATVSSEFDRIFVGDRIRRAPAYTLRPGDFPSPVESELAGVVLWFPEERAVQGYGAKVFLDLGLEDGLEIGDIFRAYVDELGPGRGLEAARIQIVLVEQGRATGRIVSLRHPGVEIGDTLRLVAKMY
jgi:hypothetical protein